MEVSPGTYGALLLGAFFAFGLSGIATVQAIMFFKLYPQERMYVKALVVVVWALELAHSGFIISALWDYLIANFGNYPNVDFIPLSIVMTVIINALLTCLTQCFFAHRIYRLSRNSVLLTAPIVFLSMGRLATACASGGEMITQPSYTHFRAHFRWLFSIGLALSSTVDVLNTFSLFFLLKRKKKQSMSLDEIIDSLIRYTFEMGSLTCATTVAAMICWLVLDNSLIFLGLHFAIGKLYANSLLATLNTRQGIGKNRRKAHNLMDIEMVRSPQDMQFYSPTMVGGFPSPGVEVSVEKTVRFDAS